MYCRPSVTTIKPLNATQDDSQAHSKKGKEPDVYCFPSSPMESCTEETSASKGERKKDKKAKKVRNFLNIVAYLKRRKEEAEKL